MFLLSHVVIYVYVFTVLLNFFYLKSVTLALFEDPYTSCTDCVNSKCFTSDKNPCVIDRTDTSKFICLKCDSDADGTILYYYLSDCEPNCSGSNLQCVCNAQCYACIDTTKVNPSDFNCDGYPTTQVDANCIKSPYPPTSN
jgi:hypothetical protein